MDLALVVSIEALIYLWINTLTPGYVKAVLLKALKVVHLPERERILAVQDR